MSQVIRKFAGGGKTPQEPSLFEWENVGKYNRDDLVASGLKGIDAYIAEKGLRGKRASSFREAAANFLNATKAGNVRRRADGSYEVIGGGMASTGKYDKGFLGLGTKNTENNAFNDVGAYMNSLLDRSQTYQAPQKEEPRAYQYNIKDAIKNKYFGGRDFQLSDWSVFDDVDPTTKKRGITNRLGNIALLYEEEADKILNDEAYRGKFKWDSDYSQTAQKLRDLATELRTNGYTDADRRLGFTSGQGRLDDLLDIGETPVNPTAPQKPEGMSDEAWAAQKKLAANAQQQSEQQVINQAKTLDQNEAYNKALQEWINLADTNKSKFSRVDALPKVKPYDFDVAYGERNTSTSPWKLSTYLNAYNLNPNASNPRVEIKDDAGQSITNAEGGWYTHPSVTKAQDLSNNLDYWIRESEATGESLEKLPTGEYIIPQTYDPKTGMIRAYDRTKNTLKYVPAYATETGKSKFQQDFDKVNQNVYESLKRADGGVLIAQQGDKFIAYDEDAERARRREFVERQRKAKEQEVNQPKGLTDTRTEAQIKNDNRKPADTGFTGADYARLGAIGADLVSMIPGAGIVGFGGTLANFGADWAQDGLDWGDAGRLAMNLGMDTVGLIPGLGAAAKGSKVIKNLAKWAPRALTALAAINYTGPAIDSFSKLTKNPSSLTVDDYRNLAEGLKVLIGGGKGIKRGVQSAVLKNRLKTGNSVITLADGREKVLTPTQLAEIGSHSKLQDQQAALQLLTKDDSAILSRQVNAQWRNPRTWGTNSRLRDEYNFNATRPVRTSAGVINVPVIHSNSDKRIAAMMQKKTMSIPGVDKVVTAYNDRKYRDIVPQKTSSTKPIQTTKPSELLALPAPNQVTPGVRGSFGYNVTTGRNTKDITNPSKLAQTRITGDRNRRNEIVRNERLNKQEEVRATQKTKNEALTAWATNQPSPKQPLTGAARANKEKTYREVFQPAAEREYNQVWDEAVKGKKDFGYEDVTPKRSIYAPPVPTELTTTPTTPIADKNARYLWELINQPKKSTTHVKKAELPRKSKPKAKKKTSRDDRTTKKEQGGVIQFLETGGSTVIAGQAPKKKKHNFNVLPEDVMALGRMTMGLATNNRAAEKYKEGLVPTLMDTFENTVPVQGNLFAKAAAYNQAADVESMAARPRTSDASLQLAGELEAQKVGNQARLQGDAADADMFYKTRMLAQQESDAAKARRTEVANQNRASMNQIGAAKSQIDSARMTANYAQVLAPYLAGVENQFRQNRAMKKQSDASAYQQQLYEGMLPKYQAMVKSGNTQGASDLMKDYYSKLRQYNQSMFNSPWMISSSPVIAKSGTKLTAADRQKIERAKDFNRRLKDDSKQFHKDIMESKREHNKLMMSMSTLTASLIKNAMK